MKASQKRKTIYITRNVICKISIKTDRKYKNSIYKKITKTTMITPFVHLHLKFLHQTILFILKFINKTIEKISDNLFFFCGN